MNSKYKVSKTCLCINKVYIMSYIIPRFSKMRGLKYLRGFLIGFVIITNLQLIFFLDRSSMDRRHLSEK